MINQMDLFGTESPTKEPPEEIQGAKDPAIKRLETNLRVKEQECETLQKSWNKLYSVNIKRNKSLWFTRYILVKVLYNDAYSFAEEVQTEHAKAWVTRTKKAKSILKAHFIKLFNEDPDEYPRKTLQD